MTARTTIFTLAALATAAAVFPLPASAEEDTVLIPIEIDTPKIIGGKPVNVSLGFTGSEMNLARTRARINTPVGAVRVSLKPEVNEDTIITPDQAVGMLPELELESLDLPVGDIEELLGGDLDGILDGVLSDTLTADLAETLEETVSGLITEDITDAIDVSIVEEITTVVESVIDDDVVDSLVGDLTGSLGL